MSKVKSRRNDHAGSDLCQFSKSIFVATIHSLPTEIVDYIFSYLNVKERLRTELVCRRWRDIGKNVRWSWPTRLDIKTLKAAHFSKTLVTDEILSSILTRCGPSLRQLELLTERPGYKLTSKVLGIIGKSCPNLTEIKLGLLGLPTQDLFTNWYLINLAKGCAKLKTVVIGYSYYDFDDSNLSLFLKQCHSLEYLELKENRAIKGECFSMLNRNLKGFMVEDCRRLNPFVVAESLLERCGCIEELCLVNCCKLTAPLLAKVLHRYEATLVILELDEQTMQPEEWCEAFVQLKNLIQLSLCGAVGVGDKLMKVVSKTCRKLFMLNISETDITDIGLSALASAPSLTLLFVNFVRFVTGKGIENLAKGGILEELNLTGSTCDGSFVEDGCISLANLCPNFTFLDVRDNENITDRLVDEFRSSLERGFLKGPVSLHVSGTLVSKKMESSDKLKLIFNDDESDDMYL